MCAGSLFIAPIFSAQAPAPASPAPPTSVPSATALSGIVQGIVAGKDGDVYEGVHVELSRTDGEPPAAQQSSAQQGPAEQNPAHQNPPQGNLVEQTNSDGEFTFVNVPAGPFTLTVSSDGFIPQTVSGVLKPGETFDAQTIVLLMNEATTEVRVSARQQQVEMAEAQIHVEETQHVLGFLPNFYVVYDKNPVPLTTRQKYALAWRSNIDPFTFVQTAGWAGIEQADNTFPGYGQGMQGYGKRLGANYGDTFISTELGGAVFPSLFKQDPRYWYKGTGTFRARARYAIATAVICKGDNMRWQFNYSGILGGLAAGGIANLYYPRGDRSGWQVTFENLGIGIGESAVQNLFQEFLVKKFTPSGRKAAKQ